MSEFTEADFNTVSNCIEIAHKVESQKMNMVQSAQLAIQLNQLRDKLKGLVTPSKEEKPPLDPKQELFKKVAEEKKGKG